MDEIKSSVSLLRSILKQNVHKILCKPSEFFIYDQHESRDTLN